MLIGLTGRYCAGKNHVAKLLEARGWQVLDVDKLGHRALEAEREKLRERFGEGVFRTDGTIDRTELGRRVFGRPAELAALEAIVHPAANRLTEQWIAERPGMKLAVNAALLHRSSVFARFDCVILVEAPFFTRLLRARRRDRLPLRAILKRFASQKCFEAQYFSRNTDIHIVRNMGAFGPFAALSAKRMERRLDAILTRIGMVR